MPILLSFCPEPGGGAPWLKPLAGTLSVDEDTRPPPLLRLAPKATDHIREQVTSYGFHSMTPDCSAVPVDCKTNAEKANDFKDVAGMISNGKRMTQRIGRSFDSGQGKPIPFSDDDAEDQPISSTCLSNFMVDDISGMTPSHARFCDNRFGVADHFNCLPSGADLSTAEQVLIASHRAEMENARSLKAPLLGDYVWNMYDRGRTMESMVCDGNETPSTMRQCLDVQNLEMIEHFEQGKMSRSSSGAFWTVKHLADLIAQLLSLMPYSTRIMMPSSSETWGQFLTEATVLKDTAVPKYAIARALNLSGPGAITKHLTTVERFDPLGDPG